ncbi:hypothetical protein QC762_123640 [Podospora pseudocomata]|uniref:Uncharacterized protein n=2 Tax=Podospora TaxID=5144 RepID=A0ABR0GZ80_9PEZI|nr:hypothetical protein QC762_123640 [Podospora pseudocomata]
MLNKQNSPAMTSVAPVMSGHFIRRDQVIKKPAVIPQRAWTAEQVTRRRPDSVAENINDPTTTGWLQGRTFPPSPTPNTNPVTLPARVAAPQKSNSLNACCIVTFCFPYSPKSPGITNPLTPTQMIRTGT